MSVGSTIVVEFGSGADSSAFVAVELDEVLNVDAAGEPISSWSPGDEVWFWIQHDPTLRLDRIAATSGMVVDCGTARRERQQELTWTSEEGITLSHLPAAPPVLTWYGNVGNRFALAGRTATVEGNLPCTCDALIPLDVRLYRYIPPPLNLLGEQTYRVVIVIHMEAA